MKNVFILILSMLALFGAGVYFLSASMSDSLEDFELSDATGNAVLDSSVQESPQNVQSFSQPKTTPKTTKVISKSNVSTISTTPASSSGSSSSSSGGSSGGSSGSSSSSSSSQDTSSNINVNTTSNIQLNETTTLDNNTITFSDSENSTSSSETPIVFDLDPVENGQDAVLNISIAPKGSSAKGVPVLLYHGIVKENPESSQITLENFREQMSALHEEGFTTVTIEDLSEYVKGEKDIPDKSILITFDDGKKESYVNADPVLREYGFNAVMFLISKYSTRGRTSAAFSYMNSSIIKEMLSGRWEIEAHAKDSHTYSIIDGDGKTGPFLTSKLWNANKSRIEYNGEYRSRINNELINAKADLENNFSVRINSFAYPYGQYGQKITNYPEAKSVIDDLSHENYDHVFYQTFSGEGYSYNFPNTNKFMMKRITVLPEWKARDVLNAIASGREKTLPYNDRFKRNNGWFTISGDMSLKNSELILANPDPSQKGAAFLDGTLFWKDYFYTVKVHYYDGETLTLMTRMKDKANYVSCDYSDDKVRVFEVNKGSFALSNSTLIDGFDVDAEHTYTARVWNNKIFCMVDDKPVLNAVIKNSNLFSGGIGLKTAASNTSSTKMMATEVLVEDRR